MLEKERAVAAVRRRAEVGSSVEAVHDVLCIATRSMYIWKGQLMDSQHRTQSSKLLCTRTYIHSPCYWEASLILLTSRWTHTCGPNKAFTRCFESLLHTILAQHSFSYPIKRFSPSKLIADWMSNMKPRGCSSFAMSISFSH